MKYLNSNSEYLKNEYTELKEKIELICGRQDKEKEQENIVKLSQIYNKALEKRENTEIYIRRLFKFDIEIKCVELLYEWKGYGNTGKLFTEGEIRNKKGYLKVYIVELYNQEYASSFASTVPKYIRSAIFTPSQLIVNHKSTLAHYLNHLNSQTNNNTHNLPEEEKVPGFKIVQPTPNHVTKNIFGINPVVVVRQITESCMKEFPLVTTTHWMDLPHGPFHDHQLEYQGLHSLANFKFKHT